MNTPYLIKIDPTTIKKNPHAGQTVFYRPFGTETEEVKVFYGNGWWNREVYLNGIKASVNAVKVKPNQQVMEALPVGWHSSESVKQLYDVIHTSQPGANYLFEYEDTPIECDNCQEKFGWKSLESVDYEYCDDEGCYYDGYNDRVCPRCQERDCCWLRFEELDQTTGLIK